MERDGNNFDFMKSKMHFNSHAHVERDHSAPNEHPKPTISTHTLTWSVTSWLMVYARYILYFNSHAHVERDERFSFRSQWNLISTHTLTWSVTKGIGIKLKKYQISTHTLTWSVTYSKGKE